jgi:hypothetical protein
VIAEGSGTLFGIAGDTGWAFEGELDGGLDCQTGEFRANAANGIFGLAGPSDPSDPGTLGTVLDPALGAFDGMFTGMHAARPNASRATGTSPRSPTSPAAPGRSWSSCSRSSTRRSGPGVDWRS